MDYKLVFSETAERDLENLNRSIACVILKKLKVFMSLKNPFIKAKKLKGFAIDTYRFRVGNYRVIFRIDQENNVLVILVVLKIAHRKDVYR